MKKIIKISLSVLFCISISQNLKANTLKQQINEIKVKEIESKPLTPPQSCCLTIALNQLSVLHDAANAYLNECSFNGGSNCGSGYNNFTAAGLAYIEAQAESCESGDNGMQCGG